jgi:hypothetical protein
MQIKQVNLDELNPLAENPRIIDTYKYQTLLTSLREFPEMLNLRPLLVDLDNNILCGNMRFRAATELGMEQISVIYVDLPEEKKKELIIKDNISYGDWDEEALETSWDKELYNKWMGFETFDYATLNYDDLSGAMADMTAGVRKALHIDFGEFYDRAKELTKNAREEGVYIGGLFIKFFQNYRS